MRRRPRPILAGVFVWEKRPHQQKPVSVSKNPPNLNFRVVFLTFNQNFRPLSSVFVVFFSSSNVRSRFFLRQTPVDAKVSCFTASLTSDVDRSNFAVL
jgi:hypothetical protein